MIPIQGPDGEVRLVNQMELAALKKSFVEPDTNKVQPAAEQLGHECQCEVQKILNVNGQQMTRTVQK